MKDTRTAIAEDNFSAISTEETVILMIVGGTLTFGGCFEVGGEGGESLPVAAGKGFFVD